VINPEALREMGKWAALGFYETLDQPWPRAYRRMYENLPVRVPPDGYLTPFEPMADSWTRTSHDVWAATAMIVDHRHHGGLRVKRNMAEHRKTQFPAYAAEIDALVADMEQRLPHFGGYTHSNPDIRRIVSEGFLAIEAELGRRLASVQQAEPTDEGALQLFLTLKDYRRGVHAFYSSTREALAEAAPAAEGSRKTSSKPFHPPSRAVSTPPPAATGTNDLASVCSC